MPDKENILKKYCADVFFFMYFNIHEVLVSSLNEMDTNGKNKKPHLHMIANVIAPSGLLELIISDTQSRRLLMIPSVVNLIYSSTLKQIGNCLYFFQKGDV